MLSRLSDIGDVYPAIRQVTERIDSAYIELKDIARDISNLAESIDFDPARLTMANERLDTIYTLQKKHHVESVAELIAIRDSLTARLNDITNSEDMLEDMRRQVENMHRKQAGSSKARDRAVARPNDGIGYAQRPLRDKVRDKRAGC